jgi:monothiol glutaredoxin
VAHAARVHGSKPRLADSRIGAHTQLRCTLAMIAAARILARAAPACIGEIRYHLSLLTPGTARSAMDTQQRIKQIVDENPVVLFMKGNAQFPMCGFSGRAVQILKACGVDELKTVNVLEDDEIRQGIKQFSSWPTIPQLYVKGEFVGGSDIMMEMYQSGELQQLFTPA